MTLNFLEGTKVQFYDYGSAWIEFIFAETEN